MKTLGNDIVCRYTVCLTLQAVYFFISSPDLPENEATFAVTAGGIADGKE